MLNTIYSNFFTYNFWNECGCEWNTTTFEEFALKLNPMKSQSVKTALKKIHAHQDAESCKNKYKETQVEHNVAPTHQSRIEAHVEEHLSQLRVSQRKGPQSQVRSSIRHCTKHKFNSFNHLVNHQLTKLIAMFFNVSSRKLDVLVQVKFIISVRSGWLLLLCKQSMLVCGDEIFHRSHFVFSNITMVSVFVVFRFAAASINARFNTKHSGNANKDDKYEDILHFNLSLGISTDKGEFSRCLRFTLTQTHVDHDADNRRGSVCVCIPIGHPFHYD